MPAAASAALKQHVGLQTVRVSDRHPDIVARGRDSAGQSAEDEFVVALDSNQQPSG